MKTKLLLILSSAILFSCSNDDDNSNTNQQELIIGTWKYVGYIFDGNDSIPPSEYYVENECGSATETFTESGYSVWQELDDDCNEVGSPETTEYTVDGGYLIYHNNDEEGDVTLQIEELNNSRLVLFDNGEHLIWERVN